MNTAQEAEMYSISRNIIECWTRIKAKARARGEITNIEKHAPCLTGSLNNLERFLRKLPSEENSLDDFHFDHEYS